ncbi:MAG: TetR/AcrR family transcriptional regulator [Anaerolineae bacterium]|nr:TetR/AcrR family transcriptional regulator [Anaerolineae bacterium]
MPYPTQIDRDQIIQQAADMIAADGVDNLSLHKLAAALGVKAPSLYRYVNNKTELIQAVNLATLARMFMVMDEAAADSSGLPDAKLLSIFSAYRAFAHANPRLYLLAYHENDAYRSDEDVLVQMVLPLQAIMAEWVGEARSLTALRGALALVHGFALLEINNQLRRGGDLDAAFLAVVQAYLRGWLA